MEKTSTELFNEQVQLNKEANDAYDSLDGVEKVILDLRNQIDALRTQIRINESEARDWKKIIREKRYLADKKEKEAWAAKHSGL